MRKSILLLWLCLLAGCGASLHGAKGSSLPPKERFYAALQKDDGKTAAAIAASEHLDPDEARLLLYARLTTLVQEDDVAGALTLATDYGLDGKRRVQFAVSLFKALIRDGMCIRGAEFAKSFALGATYGEKAMQCVRKSSAIEAASMACDVDVGEAYREALLKEAWDALDALPVGDRFMALEVLIRSSCPLSKARAEAWFPKTLLDQESLRLGRLILDHGAVQSWGWDIHAMFGRLLTAAIGFDAEQQALEIMDDDAFLADDADIDAYLAYQIKHLRCEDAAGVVIRRKLPFARIEAIFADPKCSGTAFEGMAWSIPESDAQRWFDLALKRGKFRLARRLTDRLKDPKAAVEKVEIATLDGGDFDAAMDYPSREGETVEQHQDRVLQGALDRNDEWFVVRWNGYAQNGVKTARSDGWIERAYLHALLRKEWKMAADCIARHSNAATASEGERIAFEEALRAEDADTAIELARLYKLPGDCSTRAAILKSKQIQKAERAKAKAKAAKRKRRREQSGEWYVTP